MSYSETPYTMEYKPLRVYKVLSVIEKHLPKKKKKTRFLYEWSCLNGGREGRGGG